MPHLKAKGSYCDWHLVDQQRQVEEERSRWPRRRRARRRAAAGPWKACQSERFSIGTGNKTIVFLFFFPSFARLQGNSLGGRWQDGLVTVSLLLLLLLIEDLELQEELLLLQDFGIGRVQMGRGLLIRFAVRRDVLMVLQLFNLGVEQEIIGNVKVAASVICTQTAY